MENKRKVLIQMQKAMVCGCSLYLAATEMDGGSTELIVYFGRGDPLSLLNGLFASSTLRRMMEGRTVAW